MLRANRISSLALCAAVITGAASYFGAVPTNDSASTSSVYAQDRQWNRGDRNGGGGNRGNRGGGDQNFQRGNRGGQGGQWGGQGGNRGQWGGQGGQRGPGGMPGGFNFTPEQISANMNAERFNMLKNTPFADRVKEMVGADRWAQWEKGDFGGGATAAAQAAAAAEGKPLPPEMTPEEKAEAEALLRSGTVPNFSDGKAYSLESENEYMQNTLAHRDDSLVPALPVSIRFYARYLLGKYDRNGNNQLEQSEWDGKIQGAQAIDLDRDWILTDQEILFFLARFAKDRTISNPMPAVPRRQNIVVEQQERPVLIRTASAAPRVLDEQTASEELSKGELELGSLTDEDFMNLFKEDNPAMESVDDEELLDVLLSDMDESTVREYAAAPRELVGVPVWFLARDVNGDGQLSLREFAPNLTASGVAQFGRFDLNADGLITAEEVKKVLAGNGAK